MFTRLRQSNGFRSVPASGSQRGSCSVSELSREPIEVAVRGEQGAHAGRALRKWRRERVAELHCGGKIKTRQFEHGLAARGLAGVLQPLSQPE